MALQGRGAGADNRNLLRHDDDDDERIFEEICDRIAKKIFYELQEMFRDLQSADTVKRAESRILLGRLDYQNLTLLRRKGFMCVDIKTKVTLKTKILKLTSIELGTHIEMGYGGATSMQHIWFRGLVTHNARQGIGHFSF